MKNLILAFAENYCVDDLSPFVGSLRSSGYRGDVVFFVDDGISNDLQKFLKAHDVRMVKLPRKRGVFAAWRPLVALQRQLRGVRQDVPTFLRDCWKQDSAIGRFAYYKEFLCTHAEAYRNVILADARDVIFQEDPFSRPLESEVCLFAEHSSRPIASSGSTAKWIKRSFGTDAFEKISTQPVLCAGAIMGTVAGISVLIDELIEMMASCPAYWSLRFGLDQAALNCIVYDQRVPGVTLYSCLEGPIAHLALVPKTQFQFNDDGRLLGHDGRILPVLHQYDRHDCLEHLVAKAA